MAHRTLGYRICDAAISVSVNDVALAEQVRELFRSYEVSLVGPGTLAVRVRRANGDIIVEWDPDQRERCRSSADFIIAAEFALTETFLRTCGHLAHLHAAGAVVGDKAILALGPRGAGKSSLALGWALAGIPVLGDDIVFVDGDGRALPFKRLIKVAPALLEERRIELNTTPFWTPDSDEAWFDPADWGGWAPVAPVELLAFVHFSAGADTTMREVRRSAALEGLLRNLLPDGLQAMSSFDRLTTVARTARAYEVVYGSAASAAKLLMELMQ
jgi:hypothetical protein